MTLHLSALPEVPATILSQLGGQRFKAMTGAKEFVYGPNLLQFRVGRNSNSVTKVRVELMPTDLYAMTFYRGAGLNLREYTKSVGLCAERLQEVFTRNTGLDTHL